MEIDSLERKILRQMWRPIRETDSWGIRYIDEVHRLYGEPFRNIPVVMLKGLHWSGQTAYG
jgi:hypothetical protein